MTSEHVINLLGGLALFIFGMTFMSDGLKKLAGDYMKTILEKLTEKRIIWTRMARDRPAGLRWEQIRII